MIIIETSAQFQCILIYILWCSILEPVVALVKVVDWVAFARHSLFTRTSDAATSQYDGLHGSSHHQTLENRL